MLLLVIIVFFASLGLFGFSYYQLSKIRKKRADYKLLQRKMIALEIGKQVAHDIRSPVFALNTLLNEIQNLPDSQKNLLKAVIQRIQEIANNLSKMEEVAPEEKPQIKESCLLTCLIESLVTEKKAEFRGRNGTLDIAFQIKPENYNQFSEVDAPQFKRVLSNLINNAADALENQGVIEIYLEKLSDTVYQIRVVDHGKGIPPHILPQLMKKGATYKKSDGTGLGLYNAKSILENWGGNLELKSSSESGTEAIVTLPSSRPPQWFKYFLWIFRNQEIIILDDDPFIHDLWKSKLSKLSDYGVTVKHFSNADRFVDWLDEHPNSSEGRFYLIDQDLGQAESGVSLIRNHQLNTQAMLVTNRYDDPAVVRSCADLDIKLIPKPLIPWLPIKVEIEKPLWLN